MAYPNLVHICCRIGRIFELVRIQIGYVRETREEILTTIGSQCGTENYLIYTELQIFRYIL